MTLKDVARGGEGDKVTAMNNVRENSATAEGENNPHSRRIFSAKWGRLKNAFNANAG